MTTFLLILSAMLGTLTQATYCPMTDLNGSIKWMEMLSAWNTNAFIQIDIKEQMSDKEFFAWQDAREQERLDAIMDQPVEHVEDDPYYFIDKESWAACYEAHLAVLDKEAEAAHDQHMEAKVWEHHAWQNLVDEVIDAILMEDDYQYMKEWSEFTKDWSKTDSSDESNEIDISGYQIMLVDKICKISNCYEVEFVQSLYLLEAQELHDLIDQYNKPPKGYCYIGCLRASTDKACFITDTGASDSLGLWYPKKLSWQMPRTNMMYIPVWLLMKRAKEREMNTPRVWQA